MAVSSNIIIPQAFAKATINREGEAGRQWIAQLPHQVEALCYEWQLVVDGPAMHGYLALAIPVRAGQQPLILKISWPDPSTTGEARAPSAWDGRGTVCLLATEPAHGAMLLEQLDPGRTLEQVDLQKALVIAGRLLRRLLAVGTERRPDRRSRQVRPDLPAVGLSG